MNDIQPKMVDGRPVCDMDCPLYTLERHEQEAANGGVDCNDEGGLCEPYYRARVAELTTALQVAVVCMAAQDPGDYLAVFTAEEIRAYTEVGRRLAAAAPGGDFNVEDLMRAALPPEE